MHARNPARTLEVGGDYMMFSPVASPPNCSDLERGRRPGNRADFRNFLKLGQYLQHPAPDRRLHGRADRHPARHPPPRGAARHLHADRQADPLLLAGLGPDPRRHRDVPHRARHRPRAARARAVPDDDHQHQLAAAARFADGGRHHRDGAAGQIVVLTPFTLAGAMAPVTVAGAVAQQNAEALLGIALTQLVRPGAPVIYGGFTSNVDMKSGAPAFGTPEYMKSVLLGGQLARRYRLPYRTLEHRPPPTRSTARRCTSRSSRSGPWSWAAATWSSTRPAGSKAACAPRSRSW